MVIEQNKYLIALGQTENLYIFRFYLKRKGYKAKFLGEAPLSKKRLEFDMLTNAKTKVLFYYWLD